MGAVYFAAMLIEECFLLLLVIAATWYWLDSLQAREAGVSAARAACAEEGWQFLDESVAGCGVSLARDAEGRLRLRRIYAFEYSKSGFERSGGSVTLLGQNVEWLSILHASSSVRPEILPIPDNLIAFPGSTPVPTPSTTPQPTARIIQLRPPLAAPMPAEEENKDPHAPQDLHD